MVLNSTEFISNFGEALASGIIGSDPTISWGMYLIGAMLLITVVICLFSIRMGLFGAIVILPPTIIILSEAKYIPQWIGVAVSIIAGIIVAWIFLSMLREG